MFTRLTFGFLYSEFTNKYYYWEFIRMFVKVGISLFYNVFDDFGFKHFTIFFILLVYMILSNLNKPINSVRINKFDETSHFIIMVLVIFKQRIYITNSSSEKIILSVFITVLNFGYIIYLLFLIFKVLFRDIFNMINTYFYQKYNLSNKEEQKK